MNRILWNSIAAYRMNGGSWGAGWRMFHRSLHYACKRNESVALAFICEMLHLNEE